MQSKQPRQHYSSLMRERERFFSKCMYIMRFLCVRMAMDMIGETAAGGDGVDGNGWDQV